VEEANVSDGDRTNADGGRPQYFIRNSDSSATSGDDISDDSSGAGAESAGDSPQGKSDVAGAVAPRPKAAASTPPAAVSHNRTLETERHEETERGV
jgi:hypothetical protein